MVFRLRLLDFDLELRDNYHQRVDEMHHACSKIKSIIEVAPLADINVC
jgi:hypothetical protein